MFNVVAPNQDKLPLAVETERVDEAEPRLPSPPSWDPQPVREHHAIDDRHRHENGDPASCQNGYPAKALDRGKRLIQPLHAVSNARAADRAGQNLALRRGDRLSASSTPLGALVSMVRRIIDASPDQR
jgi:hypothetical protein